jgi:hypothetical protein
LFNAEYRYPIWETLDISFFYDTGRVFPTWSDLSFADFIAGIQFLPTTIMMVHLCPSGSEGASYAMFTTVNNSAGNLAGAMSTLLLGVLLLWLFDLYKHLLLKLAPVQTFIDIPVLQPNITR